MILNLSGGSNNSLNFKVVGGTTQPTNPKENTIWVNTNVDITGYAFSETEPTSKSNGMVWFCVGSNSTASFNAIKKDIIMVYPVSVKQYSSSGWGGSWVEKEAKIYMNGGWVVLGVKTLWIFKSGTGLGQGFTGFTNATCNAWSITQNVEELYVRSSEPTVIGLNESIDVTNYKTLNFSGISCDFNANGNANETWIGIFVAKENGTLIGEIGIGSTTQMGGNLVTNKSASYDVSNIKEKVYLGVYFATSAAYPISITGLTIGNIWID